MHCNGESSAVCASLRWSIGRNRALATARAGQTTSEHRQRTLHLSRAARGETRTQKTFEVLQSIVTRPYIMSFDSRREIRTHAVGDHGHGPHSAVLTESRVQRKARHIAKLLPGCSSSSVVRAPVLSAAQHDHSTKCVNLRLSQQRKCSGKPIRNR